MAMIIYPPIMKLECAILKVGQEVCLTLHINNLDQYGEGGYTLNASNCENGIDGLPNTYIFCRWWDEGLQAYKWYCSIENGGELTITRYGDGYFAGTFNCTLVNRDDPNDFIEVTEGRFDIYGFTLENTEFP